jgi:cyanobactin cluster PatC/TenC/TruC protein
VSPVPKKPAVPNGRREPPAAKPKRTPMRNPVPVGPRSPALAAGTGQLMPGGCSSSPLPVLTRERPAAAGTAVVAGLPRPTPGAAGPRGAAVDEPWPAPVQIERVSAAPLETGLSDYAFWLVYFADHTPPPPPTGGFRPGEIWA